MMKLDRMGARGMMFLALSLGAYGLLTCCLMLAAFLTQGADLALLIAAAAGSISVPVSGLLVLLVAWWQGGSTERSRSLSGECDQALPQRGHAASLIDRSIIIVGQGDERLTIERGGDGLRLETRCRDVPRRDPAPIAGLVGGVGMSDRSSGEQDQTECGADQRGVAEAYPH